MTSITVVAGCSVTPAAVAYAIVVMVESQRTSPSEREHIILDTRLFLKVLSTSSAAQVRVYLGRIGDLVHPSSATGLVPQAFALPARTRPQLLQW